MKKNYQKTRELDLDPLSTTVVEDLLESNTEWKGVPDIIKLSLKALTDIVRVQGASVREINNALPTRASKNQLSTGLSLKANINDVSRTISQVSNMLQSKITLNEMHDVMRDYITRQELHQSLLARGHLNTLGVSSKMVTSGTSVDSKIDQFQRHFDKKMSGYVTLNQFQQLLSIVQQKPSINEVNQILQSKVSKPVFNTALQKLIVRSEMQLGLSKKADITDLEYIVSTLQTKVDLSTIEKLTEVIENKTDKSDLDLLIAKTDQIPNIVLESIDELKRDLQKVGQDREIPLKKIQLLEDKISNIGSNIHTKISHNQTSAMIANMKYEVNQQIAKMKMHIRNHLNEDQNKTIELFSAKQLLKQVSNWKREKQILSKQIEGLANKIEQFTKPKQNNQIKSLLKEVEELRNDLGIEIEQKLSTDQLEQVLAKWVQQIHLKMSEDRQDTLHVIKEVQQGFNLNLGQHSLQIKQLASLVKKSSHEDNFEEISRRIRRDVDDMRKTVDKIYNEVDSKLSQSQYQSDLLDLKKKIQLCLKQLSSKSNIKDVCVLIDSKPNVDEINKALKEIHEQLEAKVSSEQLRSILQDQATINQTLCEENIIGRWLWHSGQLRAGNLVPWEAQTVNTLPHNFLWDKDQTSILALASGLYEITVNVFSKYPTIINLLVNGQPVLIRQSTQDKQNINQNKKKKSKQIVSIKIHEFFMLPTRARVSLSSSGEPGSQGFLSIKRL